MEYRKYRAETLKEAKLKMLLDVGKKGYIIKQRTVKEGGIFGLFGKSMVEITVNVLSNGESREYVSNADYMDSDLNFGSKSATSNLVSNINGGSQRAGVLTLDKNVDTKDDQYRNSLERIQEIGLKMGGLNSGAVDNIEKNRLKDEILHLKSLLSDGRTSANNSSAVYMDMSFSSEENKILSILKDYDFEVDVIKKYLNLGKYERFVSEDFSEKELLEKIVSDLLGNQINLIDGMDSDIEELGKRTLAFVGPTGVGKTTTLAKLGAYYGILRGKSVKFISADNYRVGAVQQLKIYSEIMEIPFSKVTSVEELREEVEDEEYDIILIDTAGRSQKTRDDIDEIKNYLDIFSEDEISVSLVISATTKFRDLSEILDKFSVIKFRNVIATKLDETNTFGQVLSALVERDLTLSHISFGQSVPEDLKSATRTNLLEILFDK